MKVRITQEFVAPLYGQLFLGSELDVPESYARAWVNVNRAVFVDAPVLEEAAKPVPAPAIREKASVPFRHPKVEKRRR